MPSHTRTSRQHKPSRIQSNSQMQGKMPPDFKLHASTIKGKNAEYLQPEPIRAITKKQHGKSNLGTYAGKKFEQLRLTDLFDRVVTGKNEDPTHEAEHVIGFEPLNRDNHAKRGEGDLAKSLEACAPAYQEEYDHHRKHIGTGSSRKRDSTGMNAQEYRDSQRNLLLANEPGVAVQLNQLGYGHNKQFRFSRHRAQLQSNDSFHFMMANVKSFPISNANAQGGRQFVHFKPEDIKECLGSRAEALVKRHLNPMDITMLQTVVEGKTDYNAFVYCFQHKNYAPMLKKLGMEDLQEHFQISYQQYDRDATAMDVD